MTRTTGTMTAVTILAIPDPHPDPKIPMTA